MKRSTLSVLCALLLVTSLVSTGQASDFIHTRTLADAIAKAKESGSLIIIDYAMDN